MVGEHAIHNGMVISVDQAVLPITNREVQSGFYVYESLRIIGSHAVHLFDHLHRLDASCSYIRLVHSFSSEQISEWVEKLIVEDGLDSATMRIQIYGGATPHLFITATPILSYPDSYYAEGISVYTYTGERFLPSAKTGNLLLNYLALEEARRQGGFEALLVDPQGRVLEGTRSNFFAIRGNRIFTAADDEVLLGITRDRVLKAAQQTGLSVEFTAPLAKNLIPGFYDELFISATSMAAMPVAAVDGKRCGSQFAKTLVISRLVRQWEMED